MPASRVKSIDFLGEPGSLDPASGECRLRVNLEDGRSSTFVAATFDRAAKWVADSKDGARWSAPALYAARLDKKTVRAAVDRMAADKGGYWLRYYNTEGTAKAGSATSSFARADLSVTDGEGGCGVVEAFLKDGRQFTLLTATPEWFAAECADLGLSCYYGAPVLFLEKLDPALARKAVKAMHAEDEQLLMRYDTPRRTLPDVLAEFASLAG